METVTACGSETLLDVRLAVLRQHTQLAQRLDDLERGASAVIRGEDCAGQLNDALIILHRRLKGHLDYEEERLAPLLDLAPADVAARLRASFAEHQDQRARVDGLLHDRVVFADPKTIAREAIAFIHTLRADIEEENAALRAIA